MPRLPQAFGQNASLTSSERLILWEPQLAEALVLILRNVTEDDLPIFFEHQRDPVALRMAAFPSREREAFLAHWRTQVLRPEHLNRTIAVDGRVVGYIGSWEQDGKRLVAYWIGREDWGKGIATRALSEFLVLEQSRPLHAWVALHNAGSIRVLEKCGFCQVAQEGPQARGRGRRAPDDVR